jgi:hypothetical protein
MLYDEENTNINPTETFSGAGGFYFIYLNHMEQQLPTIDEYEYRDFKLTHFPNYYSRKYGFLNEPETHSELLEKIYRYEIDNVAKIIRNGIDPNTHEYGYFLL